MAKYKEYKLPNDKTVRIPLEDIARISKGLDVSEDDACLIWLEDEGKLDNEEQNALDKKAKESKITATIHKASADKPKEKKKVERKPDEIKENIISALAQALQDLAENVTVTNIGKYIEFDIKNEHFTLDLKRNRPKKEKTE